MAQLERIKRSIDSPKSTTKSQNSPTFEQLLRDDNSFWSGMNYGHEECLTPNSHKKSVLSKVKEGAKKLKHTLSGKKYVHENTVCEHSSNPTFNDHTLDDNDNDKDNDVDNDDHDESVDDPEYLGAPMYELEAAPESLKENARQNPRVTPVVAENHRMPSRTKPVSENDNLVQSSLSSGNQNQNEACSSSQTLNKGFSVKEFIMNKLEPGDDERALSHAITEAISPRRTTNNTGVVEKVREAVTSIFWQQENASESTANRASSFPASRSSKHSYVPTDRSGSEVLDEESHGKILQTN